MDLSFPVVARLCGAVASVLRRRPGAISMPGAGPTGAAGDLPAPSATVRVRTHFGADGGYIEHNGLVLWATVAPGHRAVDFTPGTSCVVRAVRTVHADLSTIVVADAVPGLRR